MSLAHRSVRSSTYTISASAITTVVQFVRAVLLARLLTKETFGIYAFASSFVLITRILPDFGMTSALLHHAPESEGEEALRVHFTLSIIFNTIWAAVIAIIGYFFVEPASYWVLIVILITQFIDNMVQTGRAQLIRRVIFKRIALIDIITTILSTVAALYLAWQGYGVWSLVSTDIIASIVPVYGFYIYRPPWQPRLGYSREIARYLIGFGKKMLAANLVGQLLDYIDNLWTGRVLGDEALGDYSRAYTFATYPRKILSMPLGSIASGTYAEIKNDRIRLSKAFFRVNALLIRTSFLFAGLLALVAPEFITLLLGVKWMSMLTAFRLMLLFTLLDPIKSTIASLFTAVGKPEKILQARSIQLVVMIAGLFVFTKPFGIAGVAIAVNLMLLVGVAVMLWQARAYVQYSLRRLFLVPSVGILLGITCARAAIEIPGILGSAWRTGFVKGIVFSILYAGTILIFERKQIPMFLRMANLYKNPNSSESEENEAQNDPSTTISQ